MSANYTEWYIQLINSRTQQPIDDDSGVYNVLTAGSPSEVTIYSNDKGTSGSNPGTMTDGIIHFWTASTVTSVDISIYTANGDALFLQSVSPSDHHVEVDVEKLEQNLVIPFGASDNSETDTGFTLISPVVIEDIELKVTAADAAETIDFGLNGSTTDDPDGLIAAASVASATFVDLGPIVTSGANEDYLAACYYGALLADFTAGADAATDVGTFRRKKCYIVASETDANVTYTGSAGSDTAAGYAILKLKKML
jgi:hypothetical protein